MKNLLIIVVASCLIILFHSCKKDENDKQENSFRLKAWSDPEGEDRVDIIYEGDRIKEMQLTRDGKYGSKLHWVYVGDSIKLQQWFLHDTGWRRSYTLDHILIVDNQGRLVEHLFHVGNEWQINYEFEWEGDKLKRQSGYYVNGFSSGAMEFTYSGDKITRMDYNQDFGYEELIYEGDHVVEMKYYLHDELTRDVKFENDNNQMSIIKYDFSSINSWEKYTYDNNNNPLTRTRYFDTNSQSGTTTEFEYEAGKGNLDLYWLGRYGRLATYYRTNMIPSSIAVGTWSLCGEREWMQL